MIWISYFLAIVVSPGNPPPNFQPNRGEWRRWCKKCENYKPERSHHCKTCNQCVLQMDHHCPWTMSCVGYKNFGHFLRFLGWVVFTTGLVAVELSKRVGQYYHDSDLPSYLVDKKEMVAVIFLLPIDLFVFFSVLILMIRVLINLGKGMTQIETWEWERIESQFHTDRMWFQIRKNYFDFHHKEMPELTSIHKAYRYQDEDIYEKQDDKDQTQDDKTLVPLNFSTDDLVFPYDLGFWRNIFQVCGYPWYWLLPWQSPSEAGYLPPKSKYMEDDQLDLPWPPDGGHQELKVFANDTNLKVENIRQLGLMKKRLDPRSTMNRTEWMNDVGEKLDDYGVDVESETFH